MNRARNRYRNYFSGSSGYPVCNAVVLALFVGVLAAFLNFSSTGVMAAAGPVKKPGAGYLPDAEGSKIVSVRTGGPADVTIMVVTEPIAVTRIGRDGKPQRIGDVNNFSPAFIGLHREQSTRIWFWNVEPKQDHDFALLGPDRKVLMYEKLPPLRQVAYVFTFHQEGLFDFKCLEHQPDMSGQFLVLPPVGQTPLKAVP